MRFIACFALFSVLSVCVSGDILAWGHNEKGQLALGDVVNRNVPTPVTFFTGAAANNSMQLVPGVDFGFYLTANWKVYAFGSNSFGELGVGQGVYKATVPQQVTALNSVPVIHMAAGNAHAYALALNGDVYVWGSNLEGQLGMADTVSRWTPVKNTALSGQSITQIVAGEDFTAALTSAGSVYTMGQNARWQCGRTSGDMRAPGLVLNTASKNIVELAAGRTHMLARSSTGAVYSWGDNKYGQAGIGASTSNERVLISTVIFPAGTVITGITAGDGFSAAISSTGQLFTWGFNYHGAHGQGDTGFTAQENKPTLNKPLADRGKLITGLAAGWEHMVVITSHGQLYAWGNNEHGQLGLGHNDDVLVPTLVSAGGPRNAQKLIANGFQTYVIQWSTVIPPAAAATNTYTVAAGDTFASVAATYGYTWQEFLLLNNNIPDVDALTVGQPLKTGLLITVQSGDTLQSIAAVYSISWEKLLKDNPQIVGNQIFVNQVLVVRPNLEKLVCQDQYWSWFPESPEFVSKRGYPWTLS